MAGASVSPKGFSPQARAINRKHSPTNEKMSDKSDILVDNKGLEPLTLSTSRRRSTN